MSAKTKYNNLPTDVINSIEKLEIIIKIVEGNLFRSKGDISREIEINLGPIQNAERTFSLYYPIKGVNLATYIAERKKTEAIKAIKNMKNEALKNRRVYEITQLDRVYFNKKLKSNPEMIEAFDVDKVAANISCIYDNLYNLNAKGIIKTNNFRTKVLVESMNWDIGLRIIFAMREYISINEEKNMEKIIAYNMLLSEYEWMENHIKTIKDYNIEPAFRHLADSYKELNDNRQSRIMEFILYYKYSKKMNIGDLTYYCVDRSCFKDVMDYLILPNNLWEYRTILSKGKLALRLMMKSDAYILSYVKEFKLKINDDLERDVFSYLLEKEDKGLEGNIDNIYQYLCEKYQNLEKNDINKAIKNLLLDGFISLSL